MRERKKAQKTRMKARPSGRTDVKAAQERQVASLLTKPYARVVMPDEDDGGFTAYILEFPGCVAEGDTAAEAYANLDRAAESWLLACVEQGRRIPAPMEESQSSGRFALRLPRSLHARTTTAAANDGVSLNQFFVTAIAEHMGARHAAFNIAAGEFQPQRNQGYLTARLQENPPGISVTNSTRLSH